MHHANEGNFIPQPHRGLVISPLLSARLVGTHQLTVRVQTTVSPLESSQ